MFQPSIGRHVGLFPTLCDPSKNLIGLNYLQKAQGHDNEVKSESKRNVLRVKRLTSPKFVYLRLLTRPALHLPLSVYIHSVNIKLVEL
jgi:hypothetical protein